MFSMILLSLLMFNSSLNIDLWVNKEDAVYYPTENLKVFFQTNRNCYIAVYNIEPGGRVSRLFPPEDANGWIEADQIYTLPPETTDYDYVIEGSEGIETIIALASEQRLPLLDDEGTDIISEAIEIYIKEPDPVKLRIISTPKDCQIYITDVATDDEEYVGETPRTIVLRNGEYVVKIEKLGFRTLTRRISLESSERRRVFVKLCPKWY